jgi:RND family efflux transporter MFP subunit
MFMARAGIGLLAAVGLTALGCNHAPQQAATVKPAEVFVTQPVTKEVTEFEDFTGRTEAVDSIEIRARVTGYLDKVHFKEGAEVKQGDLLFEIDPRPYQAELDRAEANVVQAQAHLTRLDSDFERAKGLIKNQAIGKEEFDRISGDRAEAAAALGVAQASRALAKLNLDYTKITAPITGRISRRYIDPGNLVKADDTVLTSVVSQDPIYAYFDVDERTVLRLRRLIQEGKIRSARETEVPVLLGLADEEGFSRHGTINFADNRVDPNTGTLRVRAIFPNAERILSAGLFVRIRLPVGTPHPALLIPEQALGTDQGQKFLYVVTPANEVEYRKVKIGPMSDGLRVIEDGLKAGERVIVNGLQRVRPGVTKVEAKPAPLTAPSTTAKKTPVTFAWPGGETKAATAGAR